METANSKIESKFTRFLGEKKTVWTDSGWKRLVDMGDL